MKIFGKDFIFFKTDRYFEFRFKLLIDSLYQKIFG